jgi:renalase
VRVAVIGAGLSGLTAARHLVSGGCEVVVFEKSRGLGGRLATRRAEGTVIDHGAPALDAPAGSALEDLARGLGGESATVATTLTGVVAGPPDPDAPLGDHLISWPDGLTQLAKRMAADLEIVRGVRISTLRACGDGFELGDEQGNGHGFADRVVISAPGPQAADLLERSPADPGRLAAVRRLAYHPAVMAVIGARLSPPPSFAILRPTDGPLAAVSVETSKGREPIGGVTPLVARFAPGRSVDLLDAASDDEALAEALPAIEELLGARIDVAWSQVKRWRFCVPSVRGSMDEMNPPGSRIVLCGDSVCAPGMAAVHTSGVVAAERVLSTR